MRTDVPNHEKPVAGSTPGAEKHSYGQTARRKARKRALDVLFEADLRGGSIDDSLIRHAVDPVAQAPMPEYARDLVEGVHKHAAEIDDLLRTYAEGWELQRMPIVDRNVLRIAIYELMHRNDVPDPVVIDEAVALVKELSTDESPRFVNGLLGRLQLLKGT